MTSFDPATIFSRDTDLDPAKVERLTDDALSGCDDGELYLQWQSSESFSFDDGRLKAATFDTSQGFGLRGVSGETRMSRRRDVTPTRWRRWSTT